MLSEISLNDKLPRFNLEATMLNKCSDADLLGNWSVLFLYTQKTIHQGVLKKLGNSMKDTRTLKL